MRCDNYTRSVRHRTVSCLTLAVCIALPACDTVAPARTQAPADSAAGELAFELKGPNEAALVVPVHINGRGPINFVLEALPLRMIGIPSFPWRSLTPAVGMRAPSAPQHPVYHPRRPLLSLLP